ncbi:pecanex-like protein 3 [Ovis aries]|uniref:pecanex-like protein 3 n=1 Tax=Ovis aries TaxID=9940 RepID=UPI0029528068|nr:pecanex-like protein 3 [Ovis aries]
MAGRQREEGTPPPSARLTPSRSQAREPPRDVQDGAGGGKPAVPPPRLPSPPGRPSRVLTPLIRASDGGDAEAGPATAEGAGLPGGANQRGEGVVTQRTLGLGNLSAVGGADAPLSPARRSSCPGTSSSELATPWPSWRAGCPASLDRPYLSRPSPIQEMAPPSFNEDTG